MIKFVFVKATHLSPSPQNRVFRLVFVTCFVAISVHFSMCGQHEVSAYRNALPQPSKRVYWEAKNNKNEVAAVFSGLFLFYKTFFSSQDQNVCSFTPSCSEFGILAVKRFGPVKGGVMTMDRLTRCNGLSPQNYEFDHAMKLMKDPVVPVFKPIVLNE